MTEYKAMPEHWADLEQAKEPIEIHPNVFIGDKNTTIATCILELRARIEALEADGPAVSCDREPASVAAQPTPAGPLVERVAIAITPTSQTLNREWARAAIREVAAWLRVESKGHFGSGTYWSQQLEKEAER